MASGNPEWPSQPFRNGLWESRGLFALDAVVPNFKQLLRGRNFQRAHDAEAEELRVGDLDAIEAEKPPIVRSVRLFSLYRGASLPAGTKSLAFRVVMQDTERTLTDAEADAARDTLVSLLGLRFSATLRT